VERSGRSAVTDAGRRIKTRVASAVLVFKFLPGTTIGRRRRFTERDRAHSLQIQTLRGSFVKTHQRRKSRRRYPSDFGAGTLEALDFTYPWRSPMNKTGPLDGKVALVTGGSRGIGAAAALALAKAGAAVAVNYKTHESEAAAICGEITGRGGRAIAVQADVSLAADVGELLRQVERQLGPVAVLVNNAGIARSEPIDQITEQSWDEIIAVNLKSVFLVTQAVLPKMRAARWGRVINLGSVAAQTGGVIGPHYAASKAGIVGLTHFCAALLAKEGITVNAIAPALIETEMITGNLKARRDLIPVGRFGTVDETAEVVVMLATNGYITGQTINVNGGWYMS
jgi:3-oxoacyl-[acyl-carrier protein] reductase